MQFQVTSNSSADLFFTVSDQPYYSNSIANGAVHQLQNYNI